MMTDSVSDALTRIRNAQRAGHASVKIRNSKLVQRLLAVLTKEGFVQGFDRSADEAGKENLDVRLKYFGFRDPAISKIIRISSPGCRVYKAHDDLQKVTQGLGLLILSTSQGVMSDREARRKGIGGEILAKIG